MKNALVTSIRDETFQAIEEEVNATFGGDDFSLWKDTTNLRTGDRWRDHLQEALCECDFLICLVSPYFLRSPYCRAEFDTFVAANDATDLDGRILPVLLRSIPLDAPRFTKDARDFYDRLKAFHRSDWTALEDLDSNEKLRIYRATAKDVCAQIETLDARGVAQHLGEPATRSAPLQPPVNSSAVPPASGYYARSSQSAGAVLANLAFSGPAHVATDHGRVVFSVRSATLISRVKGGKMSDPNFDFGADGWTGPNAHVQRVSANPYVEVLRISANAEALQGEVLCGRGESGLVRLFDLDGEEDGTTLSGKLSIDVEAVVVVDTPSANDQKAQRQADMKAKLAELVHRKLKLGEIAVEDFGDD